VRGVRRWLAADHPELAPATDLARARATLAAYAPRDAHQAEQRAFFLAWIDAHPDAALRSCLEGHLTASALVLDSSGTRALLTLHRKLGRWLQLGGHCDGDTNLASAALREALEESGIPTLELDPTPIDLDAHRIPARPGEPEHWHLDTRYLVRAPAGARELVSEESLALRWLALDEFDAFPLDDSVRRLCVRLRSERAASS